MAIGLSTGSSTVRREDILDIVINIDPVDTPILNTAKQRTATNTVHEWVQENLKAPTVGSSTEGADADFSGYTYAPGTRISNVTMINTEIYGVSGTEAKLKGVNNKTMWAMEIARASKQLSRKIEMNIVQSVYTTGASRTTRGLDEFITTNVLPIGGALTEEDLLDGMQEAWEDGGKPDVVYCHPTQKRTISLFTTNVRNTTAEKKKLTAVVDVYESPFGTVETIIERYIAVSGTTSMYIVQKDLLGIAWFRKPTPEALAKTGDSEKGEILGEWALEVLAEYGCSKLTGLTV